jgi:hypothetical protein
MSVVDMVRSPWNPTKLHAIDIVPVLKVDVECLRAFTITFQNRSEVEGGLGDVYIFLEPIERDGMRIVVQMLGMQL